MTHTDALVEVIRSGFRRSTYPGDQWLQGSFEGCEPFEEVGPFQGRTDWSAIEPEFLDGHYCALSFFSEAGFRFFLPAYIVADIRGQLRTADPCFHLVHGFSDHHRSELLNPRRYGAMTWYDHARFRLSVFTREESQAIVAFLHWRQEWRRSSDEEEVATIEAALRLFWLERARAAPAADDLTG